MVVDGIDVVDEFALKAPKADPTFTGTVVALVLNVAVANNLNLSGLLTA